MARKAPRKARTTQTRTVAYIRVSTAKQAEEGFSLDAQRAKLDLYAQLHELDVVDVVVDAGASAKSLDRAGLRKALGMLRSGKADALLVVKLDRLTRSVRDLGCLVEDYFGTDGAALLSVSEQIDTRTAGGRLVLNVLASVSQWEREAISERTSATMLHMSRSGEFVGGRAPYGTRLTESGKLETEPAEWSTVTLARSLRLDGLSLRAVAAELARRGKVSRSGQPFAAVQIARMVDDTRQLAA